MVVLGSAFVVRNHPAADETYRGSSRGCGSYLSLSHETVNEEGLQRPGNVRVSSWLVLLLRLFHCSSA